jgi:hypothetical protein
MAPSPQSPTPVELEAGLQYEEDRIVVEFSIANRLDEAIYLLAHPGDLNRKQARTGEAYVSFDEQMARLRISLIPPDPPALVNYGRGVESLSRKLAPGPTYRATVTLGLPVRPWTPYPPLTDDDVADSPEADGDAVLPSARVILFETAWFPESGMVDRQPGPAPDTWWFVGSGFRALRRELVPPHPIPVDLAPPPSP